LSDGLVKEIVVLVRGGSVGKVDEIAGIIESNGFIEARP
jgi:hypothetical protein